MLLYSVHASNDTPHPEHARNLHSPVCERIFHGLYKPKEIALCSVSNRSLAATYETQTQTGKGKLGRDISSGKPWIRLGHREIGFGVTPHRLEKINGIAELLLSQA